MPVRPGKYTVPLIGRFGAWRVHGHHRGEDQYAPQGTPIELAAEAIVLNKGFSPDEQSGFGHWVRYKHPHDDHVVLESHMAAPSPLAKGGRYPVLRGVGTVGRSGNAVRVGPHDHVEVRRPSGALIDPGPYFARLWASTPTTGDDDVRLVRRKEAPAEWSLFHPSLRGDDDKQRGYLVTTDPETGLAWARTWAKGGGTEQVEPREVYIELQKAARLTYTPPPAAAVSMKGTWEARPA